VAPDAAQRAAFEEYGGADAGAVVQGIPLNIKKYRVFRGHQPSEQYLLSFFKS
jgi:hypothetical protein